MAEAQLAVLVDFENVGLDYIRPLLDQLSDQGRVIIRRAYADWSKAASKRDQLLQLGLDPIHVFRSTASGKNASDIRLAIDAIELLYRSPVDTFVIVSSDSDFVPLAMTLRAQGKRVIGAGRRGIVAQTLVTSCDRFIYLDEEAAAEHPAPVRRRAASRRQAAAAEPPAAEVPPAAAAAVEAPAPGTMDEAVSLLLRALHAAMDYEGKVSGSRLHQAMTRIDPSFDFRALGYRTFAQFLQGTGEITVTRPRGQGDVEVELKGSSSAVETAQEPHRAAPQGDEGRAGWDVALEAALDLRAKETGRETVSGAWAADQAAKILGTASLKAAGFPSLRKLLDASEWLRQRWTQQGSYVVRRRDGSEPPSSGGDNQPPGDAARSYPAEEAPRGLPSDP